MEERNENNTSAYDRYMLARLLGYLLSYEPEIQGKVWNIYVEEESKKISIIVHDSVLAPVRRIVGWVPDLEVYGFDAVATALTSVDKGPTELFGVAVSRIRARENLFDMLAHGLHKMFPGKIQGMAANGLGGSKPVIAVSVDKDIENDVSVMLEETGCIRVVGPDVDLKEFCQAETSS